MMMEKKAEVDECRRRPLLKSIEVYGFVGWIGTFVLYGK